jgi:hypothetical protein
MSNATNTNAVHSPSASDMARQMFASEPYNTARAKAKGLLLSAQGRKDTENIRYWQEVIIGLTYLRDNPKAR